MTYGCYTVKGSVGSISSSRIKIAQVKIHLVSLKGSKTIWSYQPWKLHQLIKATSEGLLSRMDRTPPQPLIFQGELLNIRYDNDPSSTSPVFILLVQGLFQNTTVNISDRYRMTARSMKDDHLCLSHTLSTNSPSTEVFITLNDLLKSTQIRCLSLSPKYCTISRVSFLLLHKSSWHLLHLSCTR